jgi:predicted O-methyltransferase YrrM
MSEQPAPHRCRPVSAAELAKASPAHKLELLLVDQEVAWFYPPAYGRAIWDVVREVRPRTMIEFGVHHAYTALVAALAMEALGAGHLQAYDRWDDDVAGQPGAAHAAQANIDKYGMGHRVTLASRDFWDWIRAPEPCDIFYFDIDNTGDKVLAMYEGLRPWIARGGVVLLEGGSAERDHHESMKNATPIRSVIDTVRYRVIVDEFPSLSRI